LLTTSNKGMEYDIYQIRPRWCLMVAIFLFFLGVNAFLKIFHSTRVCKSPHSLSRNSWTCACGIYARSMGILFILPCCSPFFYTRATFENGDFVRFWNSILWDLGVWRPMIMIIQNVPYKKGTHVKTHNHG
jgi:hypothetical protein